MVDHIQFKEFIDRTYTEVIILLEEVREYATLYGTNNTSLSFPKCDHNLVISEMLRLTTRLSAMVAWLLIQKGVARGDITAEQAHKNQYRLFDHRVCTQDSCTVDVALPPRLKRLLEKSEELFNRVSKMDRMAARLFTGVYTTKIPGA